MKTTFMIAAVVSLALGAVMSFAAVTVTNVTAVVSAEKIVTITYDLASPSAQGNAVEVSISTNGGATFFSTCTNFSGAVGGNVATGTAKQILWNALQDTLPTNKYMQARVRVWASDSMALIPAGAFQMGTNNIPLDEQMANAGPNHSVTLSAFHMEKYLVTSQLWFEVRNWALTHGYTFDNAKPGSGKAADHPVQTVVWYDCVKWCNARSEMEGLAPCYYVDAAQTIVYKTGQSNVWSGAVNWSANGYRLPTEAEFEKAARGGLTGRRFPWYDLNITHTNANYVSDSGFPYDTSTTRGYNPAFTSGGMPYTSPVGYFAPNDYGLYDMTGNVMEWCWDWFDATYYASSPGTDPRGPVSGPDASRVVRGGGWAGYGAYACRLAFRDRCPPDLSGYTYGFRCARSE